MKASNTPTRSKQIEQLIKQLKKRKDVDDLFQDAHHQVFAKTDCLTCANCCKTTGPLVTESDIERMSQKLKLKPQELIKRFLTKDPDDGLWMMNVLPCPFLLPDNYCSIYEFRPKACREFPHTDRKRINQILALTAKNAEVCPAVDEIWTEVGNKIK
jgi:Fe-S-cluster containining protein